MSEPAPKVGLFVTCLVDMMRPNIAFSAIRLLEAAGCVVDVPSAQTCCGQPGYNSGDRASARALANQTIAAFEHFDYVVAPSGSCAATIRHHYPELFADDPKMSARARALADKTYELVSFLVDVRGMKHVEAALDAKITYHDSCSGLRELGISEQPRLLLNSMKGIEIVELRENDVCCGFGGTFCVKYPDISNAIVEKKTANIADTGADMLLAGDLGCLMNMAGKMTREGKRIKARHVAEVLAGMTDTPAIGEERE